MKFFNNAQEALGVMIDGLQIQVVHMRREGERMLVLGMDRANLAHPLSAPAGATGAENPEVGGTLDLDESLEGDAPAPSLDEIGNREPETNTEVFYRLLCKYPLGRCTLAVSLMEAYVSYALVPNPEGWKGRRLKRHLMSEVHSEQTPADGGQSDERHGHFEATGGNVLSITHEDPLEILGLIDSVKPFVGNVQVGLIDPIEVVLMNLVRRVYPHDSGVTAVVYAGEEFSRVIFMRDGEYLSLSQPIHEGFRSEQVLRTICRRILYEQDVCDIPDIDHIILAGECRALKARAVFSRRFANAKVEYLLPSGVKLKGFERKDAALVSHFAVPIGLAWKALCPHDDRFYPTNFLPKARRRQQNPFEVAWHGVAMLALLIACTLLFGIRAQGQSRALDRLRLSVELMSERVRQDNAYVGLVADLNAQIEDYTRNFALIDSLSSARVLWSPRLEETARVVRTTGSVWLKRFSTAEGGVDVKQDLRAHVFQKPDEIAISGFSSRIDRVSELAQRLGKGDVHSTVRSEIRGRTVHEFDISSPVTPLE